MKTKEIFRLLKMIWIPITICVIAFGVVIFILLQLAATAYLFIISITALILSVLALQKCRKYSRLEHINYENYKELRDRIGDLEDREFLGYKKKSNENRNQE
ncbi:MAG: hypothetical protein LBK94_08545 [Prevotellaceae bacterium]|jgi:hypothetical protein|nr:hypothetical protein [Prevotellaceae bacterium]